MWLKYVWCDRSHEKFQLATIPLPSLDGNVKNAYLWSKAKTVIKNGKLKILCLNIIDTCQF